MPSGSALVAGSVCREAGEGGAGSRHFVPIPAWARGAVALGAERTAPTIRASTVAACSAGRNDRSEGLLPRTAGPRHPDPGWGEHQNTGARRLSDQKSPSGAPPPAQARVPGGVGGRNRPSALQARGAIACRRAGAGFTRASARSGGGSPEGARNERPQGSPGASTASPAARTTRKRVPGGGRGASPGAAGSRRHRRRAAGRRDQRARKRAGSGPDRVIN